MNKSNSITNLAKALSAAQAEMPVVKMNSVNPFLKNKYADLGAVIEASRPILAKNGLSMVQSPVSNGEFQIGVTSTLIHSSGEWIEETIYLPSSENKGLSVAQSAGVVISYLRRYSWSSMLGLYADEDVDAQEPKPVTNANEISVHDALLKRWDKLWNEAKEFGLTPEPLAPKLTDEEIKVRGKELKAQIEEMKGKS